MSSVSMTSDWADRSAYPSLDLAQAPLSVLARLAQQANIAARNALMSRVHRMSLRYAASRLATYAAASERTADVAQEVCVAVLQALPRYEDRGAPFEAFVYSICARKVADVQRAGVRPETLSDTLPERPVAEDGPEEAAVGVDTARRLARLMEGLSQTHREVLTLRIGVGLSAQETAQALGMSAGAVRVAQHRALAKLRQLHDASGEELR